MPNVVVSPTTRRPSHDVGLFEGLEGIGLIFRDGPQVLQEIPISENARAWSREQKSWFSGQGRLRYEDDPNGYYDAYACWTMTDGKLFPMLQWKWGKGFRSADYSMPGDADYQVIDRYISIAFTASASYNLKQVLLWLDWEGSPGTLAYSLHDNNAGVPGTSLKSGTIATTAATRYGPTVLSFSSVQAVTASTIYHIKIYQAGTADHHWKVAVDVDGAGSKTSTNDTDWSAAAYSLYYRATDTDTKRQLRLFDFKEATYAVSINDDATASTLYINGDRFKATSATSTTVVDTSSGVSTGWTADQWIGAYVRIIRGTGKGQVRQITDNDTTSLTVAAWDKQPDTTSECVIYSTPIWQAITSGLGVVTDDPAVTGDVVYFPQGTTAIRKMQVDYTNALQHAFADDSTNTADLLVLSYNQDAGPEIIKASREASTIAHAPEVDYATALTFSTDLPVGFPTSDITKLLSGHDRVIFKEDSFWVLTDGYTLIYQNSGMETAKDPSNGVAAMFVNSELWWGWSHSIQRLLADDITDMLLYRTGTQGLKRPGIPKDCVAGVGWKFFAIDGEENGVSSVICWNGYGWSEIFRSWGTASFRNEFLLPSSETT